MNMFTIYLYGISETVNILAFISLLFLAFAKLITLATGWFENRDIRIYKHLDKAFIISLLLVIIIPSKETLSQMVIIPALVESKAIQNDLPEIYNLAIEKIKKELK